MIPIKQNNESFPVTNPLHISHPANLFGRDFVVGDIHGCFDKLEIALSAKSFDPMIDRLFSVGDLIDRGPQSLEVLSWLAKPWFFSVLGNHEELCLASHASPQDRARHARHGGEWFTSLSTADARPYIDAFAGLPLTREIETSCGPIGIIHADPPGDTWAEAKANLATPPPLGLVARNIALWSCSRLENQSDFSDPLPDAHLIIVGHSVVRSPQKIGNVLHIDTGGWLQEGETPRQFFLFEVPK